MRLTAKLLARLCAASGIALGLLLTQPVAADTLVPLAKPVPMPAFRLPGLNSNGGSDADLRNKVTIIRFWASW